MAIEPQAPDTRPAVYWFWSEIPSREWAERQVAEIAGAGFGAVMIQARLSFEREHYLSDEYLAGYRTAVEAAIAAGLKVHVYDEYNWISGHAGGRTVAGADHLRERHLFWTTSAPGAASATVSEIRSDWIDGLRGPGARWVYEDGVRAWDEWSVVAAVAHPEGDAIDLGALVDLGAAARVAGGRDGCTVSLDDAAAIPADWVVTFFVSARCASSRLINYLDPRAAHRFLEVVYEPYLKALEGLEIRGFSFDHPYGGFYGWAELAGNIVTSLMWDVETPPLPSDPLLTTGAQLLALVRDVGPGTAALRCRFWEAYTARGIESFFGPLAEWTRAHGVGLTGHELLAHVGSWELYGAFPELDIRTNFGGDYFSVDRARTETLVDASNFDAQLSPIMGDSVARAHGRRRCTVEQYAARREPPEDYAAGYWELSLSQLRAQAMRLHILGMRRLLFHAFGQSDGTAGDEQLLVNPRLDFPPACNYEPWFAQMDAFAQESATVSAFIEGGRPMRDVALVYPLHTLWVHGQDHPHGRLFGKWAQLLAREGIGFDIVDDRALATAHVHGKRITIGDHSYGAVVLAGVSVLPSAESAGTLVALSEAGGTVIATEPLPAATARDGAVADLRGRIASVAIRTGTGVPRRAPNLRRAHTLGPRVSGGDGVVWPSVGRDKTGTRIVLLNDGSVRRRVTVDAQEPVTARRLRGDVELVAWPWTGEDGATVMVDLEPGEVACLHLAPAAEPTPGLVHCPAFVTDLGLTGEVLTIELEGDPPPPIVRRRSGALVSVEHELSPRALPELRLAEGWTLTVDGGPAAPIDPRRGWERQGHPTFAGLGSYRCGFDCPTAAVVAEGWALSLPAVHCAVTATLNGEALGGRGWAPYRFAITAGLLRERGNELELVVANAAANRYYAGTRFSRGPQPSGLAAAPLVHVTRRRYRVSLADVEDRTAR